MVVTALDAFTKAWARHSLTDHPVQVVGSLRLSLHFNSGISFSLGQTGSVLTTLLVVGVALAVVVVSLLTRPGAAAWGFGLLIGGGLANLIDRLAATPHRVTDFVAVGSLPVFNLADASISAGFVVLMVVALRGDRLLRHGR